MLMSLLQHMFCIMLRRRMFGMRTGRALRGLIDSRAQYIIQQRNNIEAFIRQRLYKLIHRISIRSCRAAGLAFGKKYCRGCVSVWQSNTKPVRQVCGSLHACCNPLLKAFQRTLHARRWPCLKQIARWWAEQQHVLHTRCA